MAITVDWANTKVISVPTADLTLVQSVPQVIYELDLDEFRLTLLDLQDDIEGRPWQKTFRHNTVVTLGGVPYARTIEILDPYSVTFEDGQYAVRLVGANSNLEDKTNVNQVSVRPANSAGLTDTSTPAEIAAAVWSDILGVYTVPGTFGAELATKADILASTATYETYHDSAAIVYGSVQSGSEASVLVKDNVYWQIQEDGTNGLTVDFTFYLPDDNKPGNFSVFGRYEGVPANLHFMNLQIYNHEQSAWETMIAEFMPGGITSDALFAHEFYERHIDRSNNNEVRTRIIHTPTTYNASHNVFLDYVELTSVEVKTVADYAAAVWAHAAGVQVALNAAFAAGIEGGKWHITNNQMIFYDSDNITELARFNLFDSAGDPAESDIVRRERV